MFSISRYLKATLFFTCLVSSQTAFAQTTVYSCFDEASGNHYVTNVKTSVPNSCQNIQIITLPEFKQSTNASDTGLRPAEKALLQKMASQEEKMNQAAFMRAQQVDEKVGAGIYGSWLDNRHEQCFAYKTRVAEALADRKSDVKLDRQIQRDLRQIEYYCK